MEQSTTNSSSTSTTSDSTQNAVGASVEIAPPRPAEPLAKCRMYEQKMPEVNDFVMVYVERVDTQLAGYVSLLEYGGIEGVVLLSELSAKRIRRLKSHIQVGKQEVMQVIRVDTARGYIDLTKKNLKPDEIKTCAKRYQKAKTVHSILSHVVTALSNTAESTNAADNDKAVAALESLYERAIWALDDKYKNPLKALKAAAAGDTKVFEGLDVSEAEVAAIVKTTHHRLAVQPVKVQADVQVTCFGYEGVNGIIPALKAGQQVGLDSKLPIKIHLTSSPCYTMGVVTTDVEHATSVIETAIRTVQAEIAKYGGQCILQTQARVVA